jgi:hypothetical protein
MLELWQAEGAFAQIEDYLGAEGFFGPDARGLVADLFLGYGLSQTIRRTSVPAPQEPCPLPLAVCRIHSLQESKPRIPSPRDTTTQTIGSAHLVVDYGRPSKRRREIFGSLVPFGALWRTGANEATHFRTDRDLMIGTVRVPRGTYTLWTIPERDGWTLIVNRQTGQWGTDYDKTQDVGRTKMTVASLSAPVEQFTIAIEPTRNGSGMLTMSWDTTRASIAIHVEK